jgi:hypothetical protein
VTGMKEGNGRRERRWNGKEVERSKLDFRFLLINEFWALTLLFGREVQKFEEMRIIHNAVEFNAAELKLIDQRQVESKRERVEKLLVQFSSFIVWVVSKLHLENGGLCRFFFKIPNN